MKEIGDFVRNRKNGKIYWVKKIDYKNRMYILEYLIEAGNGLEEDTKDIVAFDFDEVRANFDEESKH